MPDDVLSANVWHQQPMARARLWTGSIFQASRVHRPFTVSSTETSIEISSRTQKNARPASWIFPSASCFASRPPSSLVSPPRRSSACSPCSPFLQSYQRGRQTCLAGHQGRRRVVIGRCSLRRSPAPTPRTRRRQRCKVADTSLAVDRLGSSSGGGGGAAAETLWAGTSSAGGGPAGCREAALAVQPRLRGRPRRRVDAVRPVVVAVSGGQAGPFMGGNEAAQRQCSWRARRCRGQLSLSSSGSGRRMVSLQTRQQDVRSRGSSGADAEVVARHLLRRGRPAAWTRVVGGGRAPRLSCGVCRRAVAAPRAVT